MSGATRRKRDDDQAYALASPSAPISLVAAYSKWSIVFCNAPTRSSDENVGNCFTSVCVAIVLTSSCCPILSAKSQGNLASRADQPQVIVSSLRRQLPQCSGILPDVDHNHKPTPAHAKQFIDHEKPLINPNPSLQRYYGSLESRAGYKLVLGGTRHFGFYETNTWWPLPVTPALRAMEDKLFESLDLKPGAQVLDAGCGAGHVAIRFAEKGLRIEAIDVVEHHLQKAKKNIKAAGLDKVVHAHLGDYHHLDQFADSSFDGIYTLETFVHATDPGRVLSEFFRVLKPGGHLALYEYDRRDGPNVPRYLKDALTRINQDAAMPTYDLLGENVWRCILEENGFRSVKINDYTQNVMPMLRLFFFIAYIPYILIWLLGLEPWFVNTVAGFYGYRIAQNGLSQFVAVTARKSKK